MEFYSKSKPNLINPVVKNSVGVIMKKKSNNNTISDRISNMMFSFYNNYIKDYKLTLVFILGLVAFLLYRYYNNKNTAKNKKKEKFSDEDNDVIKEILNEQTKDLRYDTQPSFNPLQSVNQQQEYVNYPPDPLPVNLPDQGIVYTKNLYDYSKPFQNLNIPDYDYNNVYEYPSRSYYSGRYNTYNNAIDTDIVNPLGHLNNFNTSTGDFVRQMTDANTQNIVDYQSILDNTEGNLIDSLKLGPKNIELNVNEPNMEPPYATDF